MYEVTMPKLSDSMEEGKIIAWKVKEGDRVREGDVLAEIESDKAVMELEAFHDGVITGIRHGDGAEVRVGQVIAVIEEKAAGPKTVSAGTSETAEKPKKKKEATPQAQLTPEAGPPRTVAATESAVRIAKPEAGRVPVSPYARKLATDMGVDLASVAGTGPGGRITAADVERAAKATGRTESPREDAGPRAERQAAVKAAGRGPDAGPRRPDEELPPVEVRPDEAEVEDASFRLRTQALRVTQSKHVIPHFYVTRAADVTALLTRKDEMKARLGATVTHVLSLACIKAIERNPAVNRSYDRGRIIRWKGVNLGLAVATDDGLTVAVIRDAGSLSFAELVERSRDLVERARSGKLTADERRHPSFTITNLGMFGVEHFAGIINPPSSITLAVASALPQAVVRDGAIHVGQVMRLTASCDHRIVDGVEAAKFMGTLVGLLEKPEELLGA